MQFLGIVKNEELAKLVGKSPNTISTWRARNAGDLEVILELCEQADMNWLIWGEQDEEWGVTARDIGIIKQTVHAIREEEILDDPGENNVGQIVRVGESQQRHERDTCVECQKKLSKLEAALRILGEVMQEGQQAFYTIPTTATEKK